LALEAGDKFNLHERSQYVETLVHKCIDKYIENRVAIVDKKEEGVVIDPKMEAVIEKMFERCYDDSQFNQAIGVALESRRLDKVREAIEKSNDIEDKLGYAFTIAQTIVRSNKEFKNEILRLLLRIYESKQAQGGNFDYYKIVKCQFFLNIPEATAILLSRLIETSADGNDSNYLVAFQIAFDILDNENQSFTKKVMEGLEAKDGDATQAQRLNQIKSILTGEVRDRLYLQFLKKNNHCDMLVLQKIKDKLPTKNSILHGATIWTNGIMNAYTTNDSFIRDNLQWAAQATQWNRFNATATLGVIHMGNKAEAMNVLNPYFSGQGGQPPSPYSTAGAYYAYGLIHANHYNQEVVNYFLDGFRNSG
jgi:26S proteasome regulatory subunit N2